MICDPLQRPFLRWFVTAQLWLNFTWQSLHLNGLPSSPWWSFSCLRAALAVVKPFLHLVQLNSLVRTLVGWHLELFCNIEELNFLLLIWKRRRDGSLRIYNCVCVHLMQEELLWALCGKSTTVASQELSFVPELMILTKVVRSAKAPSTLFTCVLCPLLLDGIFMLFMNVVQQILLHTVRGPTLVTKMSYLFVNIHHMNFKIFLAWKTS